MYKSKLLLKGTTLEVEPFGDLIVSEENVDESWDKIKEHEVGNPGIYIYDDTWKTFEGKTILGNKRGFISTTCRLAGSFSNGEILTEAEKSGFKKIYSWLEAKKIIEQAVLKNQIGDRHSCIFVYFQIDESNGLHILSARRHSRGHLEIRAMERELEDGFWISDSEVCF
jgi:hypothetical protein